MAFSVLGSNSNEGLSVDVTGGVSRVMRGAESDGAAVGAAGSAGAVGRDAAVAAAEIPEGAAIVEVALGI